MKRVLARTIYMVIVLVLSSIAVFYAIRLSGGDAVAARVPASASAEEREAVREQLGLNDPFHEQYFDYMGRLFTGDLGNSLTNNADIGKLLTEHGRNSLILGVAAFVLVFGVGIPLGMLASLRRNPRSGGPERESWTVMVDSVIGPRSPRPSGGKRQSSGAATGGPVLGDHARQDPPPPSEPPPFDDGLGF